jgi:hemolysin III
VTARIPTPDRSVTTTPPPDTPNEDRASAITHGLGVLASVAAGIVVLQRVARVGDAWQIVSAAIYVASLIVLYTASTLVHVVRPGVARARMEVFDHCAIFVVIAATYTPFTLIALRGTAGWVLFGVVWALAAAGVYFKLRYLDRFRRWSTLIYVLMGWLVLAQVDALVRAVPMSTLLWMLAGNLTYCAGIYFLLNRRIPYGHAIWHVFALSGSACHFVAVLSQVLPGPS